MLNLCRVDSILSQKFRDYNQTDKDPETVAKAGLQISFEMTVYIYLDTIEANLDNEDQIRKWKSSNVHGLRWDCHSEQQWRSLGWRNREKIEIASRHSQKT